MKKIKPNDDPFSLSRFINTQSLYFQPALGEVRAGHKSSCWMWYIFPQLRDLGYSDNARYYGITGLEEAKAYIRNDRLRGHLIDISEALLSLPENDPEVILGWPDHLKLKSCMTLFEQADPDNSVYIRVLEKFFNGERDEKTLEILKTRG